MTLDPSLFRPESIDPETAAFNEKVEAILATLPGLEEMDPVTARTERGKWRGPPVYSPNAVLREIEGPAGALKLRCFIPPNVEGVFLHIHGGGFVLGTNDGQDPRLESIANDCNVAVLSVEYRLAPECPFPAGAEDCLSAALWLTLNAESEFGTDKLLIGGESAGAALSVATLLLMRDRHGVMPFTGANLPYGFFDMAGTPSVRAWGERSLTLTTAALDWYAAHYCRPEEMRNPYASPLYADLADMPPALFTVGTQDPLLDDTLFMHARWIAAGNQAELAVYPGGVHGFDNLPVERSRRAMQREKAFIRGITGA